MTNLRHLLFVISVMPIASPSFAGDIPAPPFETAIQRSNPNEPLQDAITQDRRLQKKSLDSTNGKTTNSRAEISKKDSQISATERVKKWTRGRWEQARKRWSHKNADFYACSEKWRESINGARYTFHDQREFIFKCMNDT